MTTINNSNVRFNYDATKTKIKNPHFRKTLKLWYSGLLEYQDRAGKVWLNSTKYAESYIMWESCIKPFDL